MRSTSTQVGCSPLYLHDVHDALLHGLEQATANEFNGLAALLAPPSSPPTSTKNEQGERDPEMHPAKKGNQWYFGMKAHIGLDGR